jgi:DNA-directed RNA polymerase subunit RPC12/RpoP
MENKIDCRYTDEVICPYCGYEYSDSWEFRSNEGELTCNNCNKKFLYTRNISIDFSTTKMPCKDDKHEYKQEPRYNFVSNTKFDKVDGEYKDINLPEKDWEYIEIYSCENCGNENFKRMTKEEYIKKYPEDYKEQVERIKNKRR